MTFGKILAAIAISTAGLIGQAHATVITFNGLVGSNGDPVSTYSESGFTVTSLGQWSEAHLYGNATPDIFTSYGSGPAQSIQVTYSGLFTFGSVDLSTGSGVANYTVRGLLSGVDAFVALTGSDGIGTGWTTVLGDGSTLIDTLIITQTQVSGISANIDNISVNAAAVPEPATLALLGLGLFGIGAARRRLQ